MVKITKNERSIWIERLFRAYDEIAKLLKTRGIKTALPHSFRGKKKYMITGFWNYDDYGIWREHQKKGLIFTTTKKTYLVDGFSLFVEKNKILFEMPVKNNFQFEQAKTIAKIIEENSDFDCLITVEFDQK